MLCTVAATLLFEVACGLESERRGKSFDLLSDSDDTSSSDSSPGEFKPDAGRVSIGAGNSGSGAGVTQLLAGPAGSGTTSIFVPYGKSVPESPGVKHYTATGHQECKVCKTLIDNHYYTGAMFHDLSWSLPTEYKEMALAQQTVLQACPEFMNNWCYEDLGGTQQLRSPCQGYLTCHYCLGLNPLHCLAEDHP